MVKYMNFLLSLIFFPIVNGDFDVVNFGAKADGITDCTKSFLSAWASACGSVETAIINVPTGLYLVGQAVFKGPCNNKKIDIRINGTIVAPSDYASFGTSRQWLSFEDVEGVSILGGTMDGNGMALWDCKEAGKTCPDGASSLAFNKGTNILISDLTSINSKLFHIVIDDSSHVTVQGGKIIAPDESPNTDGIHVERSTDVLINGIGIGTGDDCISIGPGTENLWVQNVTCGPGHGISIGSLAKDLDEEGVKNVTVQGVVFTGTQNGFRIKSWARPSLGFVTDAHFQHAVMNNVKNPILIDQNYCPRNENCPDQQSGTKINQVIYEDIQGTSATQIAVKFNCSEISPCEGILLKDVKLTYQNQPAQSSCENAQGITSGVVDPPSCL